MRAYSHDLRPHVLGAVDDGMPKPEAARTFGISPRSIERYQQQRRETGDVPPCSIPGRRRLIAVDHEAARWAQLEQRPPRPWPSTVPSAKPPHEPRDAVAPDPSAGLEPKKEWWWPPKPMRPRVTPGGKRSPH